MVLFKPPVSTAGLSGTTHRASKKKLGGISGLCLTETESCVPPLMLARSLSYVRKIVRVPTDEVS